MGHLIPVAKPLDWVVNNSQNGDIYFIGDSGRFVFSSTGGGLQGAYWSGMNSALYINDSIGYQNEYDTVFKPYLKKHYRIKKLLYSINQKTLDNIVDYLQSYKPQTLDPIEELGRVVKKVVFKHPKLIFGLLKRN
jgi:flavin-dependent dehydrogenase